MLLFSSCGPINTHVDSELVPYFDRFEKIIGVSTKGVNGMFISLDAPKLGQCVNGYRKEVQIDPQVWMSADDDAKEQLVFHELGHCAMNMGHIPDYFTDGPMYGCPVSIMSPYGFGDWYCYTQNKEYYYQELKSHKQ